MKLLAHRGIIDYENTIQGVLDVFNTYPNMGVEIDIRFNTNRKVVLCHDREHRNNTSNEYLEQLIETLVAKKYVDRHLMLDIKAFGVSEAKKLAKVVMDVLAKYTSFLEQMHVYVCSFNEYCVSEMCFLREDMSMPWLQIGVITSGIPCGLFSHIDEINFVSIDYNALCEDIVDRFKSVGLEIYAWVVNDHMMQSLMHRYGVHGMINDVFVKNLTTSE